MHSGRQHRIWIDQSRSTTPFGDHPPWAHGEDVLFVSFNAIAELTCYLSLGWTLPDWVLDLNIEFRYLVNGLVPKGKDTRSLLAAMARYGLPAIESSEKDRWRKFILTGGPYDGHEQGILGYCWTDIADLLLLLPAMLRDLPEDLTDSLYRGRYTLPAAAAVHAGIPVDEHRFRQLELYREEIQRRLTADCPVFVDGHFNMGKFTEFLQDQSGWKEENRDPDILDKWPRTPVTQELCVKEESWDLFESIPEIKSLNRIRKAVLHLNKPPFTVRGGRTYYGLIPFGAWTSRNTTNECIFQASTWLRGLIQPAPGRGLIYADYSQQEYLVMAILSGDPKMLELYARGEPYVEFGKIVGIIPPDGTGATHKYEREIAKTVSLAVGYGQTEYGIALKTKRSLNFAKDLLQIHKKLFPQVWRWSNHQLARTRVKGYSKICSGWRLLTDLDPSSPTLRNFPVQATAAETMRVASIFLFEAELRVCCPIHDAFLVECNEAYLEWTARVVAQCMSRAADYVLGRNCGMRAKVIPLRYPERLVEKEDPDSLDMWLKVCSIIDACSEEQANIPVPNTTDTTPVSIPQKEAQP
jgi:hypothetical protein